MVRIVCGVTTLRLQKKHLVCIQAHGEKERNELDILLTKLHFNDRSYDLGLDKIHARAHTIDFKLNINYNLLSIFFAQIQWVDSWKACGREDDKADNFEIEQILRDITFIVDDIINPQRVNVWVQ